MIKRAHNLIPQPTVQDAVGQVFNSGQQLIVDKIDLLRLDLLSKVESVTKVAVLTLVAGMFGSAGFVVSTVALCLWLATMMPAHQAVGIVGAGFTVLSIAAGAAGQFIGKRGLKS